MIRRRTVLGSIAGAAAGIAGCTVCASQPTIHFDLDLESITPTDDTWTTRLSLRVSFSEIDERSAGLRSLGYGCYGRGSGLQDEATIGSLQWRDVPPEDRNEGGCRTGGVIERRVELTSPSPPYYVGPRIDHGPTRDSFEAGDGFVHSLPGRVFDRQDADWPPETVSPEEYRHDTVHSLPWP